MKRETRQPPSIFDLSRDELSAAVAELGEPGYRAGQLWRAIYAGGADSFDSITTLPKTIREKLSREFRLDALEPVMQLRSRDRSVDKLLFRLADGELVETVSMRYRGRDESKSRRTVCISTQAGCALACTFCATGQQGFRRNLTRGEIVAQVVHMKRVAAAPGEGHGPSLPRGPRNIASVTNVVFMGMGEPFVNYENTIGAIETLNDGQGVNIGARHMTVSTVGLVPGILKLAGEPYQVNLAVSLHAPNDEIRAKTMPVNRRYPIASLMKACRKYIAATNRRVSFEYVLLAGENDRPEHASELGVLLQGMLCHVNLIPVNRTDASYRRPDNGRIGVFRDILRRAGVAVTVRFEKGTDINAGCGQLRARALAEYGESQGKTAGRAKIHPPS